ncbi:MAG: protein kinase [Myxococcales bacterium]|nr:protein kinase [Myxococcales bacterium]
MVFTVEDVIDNRYRISSQLGAGPTGTVYQAYDEVTKSHVAVKVLNATLVPTSEEREQFSQELKRIRLFEHENIVRILANGTEKSHVYVVTEVLNGLSLRKIIDLRRDRQLVFSPTEVEPIFEQLTRLLDDLHRSRVHGSLKPENVIVLPDVLKVTDLGMTTGLPRSAFVTAQQQYGSAEYLAPELREYRLQLSPAADIYSLGVILGEMLTGEVYDDTQPEAFQGAIKKLDRHFQGLLMHTLHSSAVERPELASEVLRELQVDRDVPIDAPLEGEEEEAKTVVFGFAQTGVPMTVAVDEQMIESSKSSHWSEDDEDEAMTVAVHLMDGQGNLSVASGSMHRPSGGSRVTASSDETPTTIWSTADSDEAPDEELLLEDSGLVLVPADERARIDATRSAPPFETKDQRKALANGKRDAGPQTQPDFSEAARTLAELEESSFQVDIESLNYPPPRNGNSLQTIPTIGIGKLVGSGAAAATKDHRTTLETDPRYAPSSADGKQKWVSPRPTRRSHRWLRVLMWGMIALVAIGLFGWSLYDRSRMIKKHRLALEEARDREEAAKEKIALFRQAAAEAVLAEAKQQKIASTIGRSVATVGRSVSGGISSEQLSRLESGPMSSVETEELGGQSSQSLTPRTTVARETRATNRPPPRSSRSDTELDIEPLDRKTEKDVARSRLSREDRAGAGDSGSQLAVVAPGKPSVPPECPQGMTFVSGGAFMLGTPEDDPERGNDEEDFRSVEVAGFCVDYYEYPNGRGREPATKVTFEAAKARCRRRGKRLCSEEEWEKACKGPGGLKYPYGNTWNPEDCNTLTSEGASPTVAGSGSFRSCRSGYNVYDLVGNVAEWTTTVKAGGYVVKGGDFRRLGRESRCSSRMTIKSFEAQVYLGFRCCSEPQ